MALVALSFQYCVTLFFRRAKLERSLVDRRVRLPQLDNLRWRVDVTISNRLVLLWLVINYYSTYQNKVLNS